MDPLRISNAPYPSNEDERSQFGENDSLAPALLPVPAAVPQAPQPMEEDGDEDREYSCRYCNKSFSNKQALGGHQNAHKIQRTFERNVGDLPENIPPLPLGLGYSANPNFLISYNSTTDYLNRTPYVTWPANHSQQQQARVQIGQSAFVQARPRGWLGFGNLYGFTRVNPYQFQGLMPSYVPNPAPAPLNLNMGLSPPSFGSVFNQQAMMMASAFASSSRFQGPGRNPGPQVINWPPEIVDESGLDLTLKL